MTDSTPTTRADAASASVSPGTTHPAPGAESAGRSPWPALNCPCAAYIEAGQSVTLRQGWTVQSADSIEFVVEYDVLKTGYRESQVWSG